MCREVYAACSPGYSGRCTAPLLVDKDRRAVVCNESSILLDGLYATARQLGTSRVELRPPALATEIEALNERIYRQVNNATYRRAPGYLVPPAHAPPCRRRAGVRDLLWKACFLGRSPRSSGATKFLAMRQRPPLRRSGFATAQAGFDEAQADLEAGLAELEQRLGTSRFLLGDRFTDADLRLAPTVLRYDAVYNGLFRCTRRRIAADCPNLQRWMQDVWLLPTPGALTVRRRRCWLWRSRCKSRGAL